MLSCGGKINLAVLRNVNYPYEAAFAAMRDVESCGWYVREREEEFAFFYYWDTPSKMKAWIDDEWDDFEKIMAIYFEYPCSDGFNRLNDRSRYYMAIYFGVT